MKINLLSQSEINEFLGSESSNSDQNGNGRAPESPDTGSRPATNDEQLRNLILHNGMLPGLCTRLDGTVVKAETPLVTDPLTLKRGQIWGDLDPRRRGRYLLVNEVTESGAARCFDLLTGKMSTISKKLLRPGKNYFLAAGPPQMELVQHGMLPRSLQTSGYIPNEPNPDLILRIRCMTLLHCLVAENCQLEIFFDVSGREAAETMVERLTKDSDCAYVIMTRDDKAEEFWVRPRTLPILLSDVDNYINRLVNLAYQTGTGLRVRPLPKHAFPTFNSTPPKP